MKDFVKHVKEPWDTIEEFKQKVTWSVNLLDYKNLFIIIWQINEMELLLSGY